VRNDAAIGLVFPALFAAGMLLINLYGRDVHIDEHTVLLGEIGFVWLDTVDDQPAPRCRASLLAARGADRPRRTSASSRCFYKELKLATFDPALATALGLAPAALFYALLALTSATAVASFDAVGAILFIAFVIVPPATAILLSDRLPLDARRWRPRPCRSPRPSSGYEARGDLGRLDRRGDGHDDRGLVRAAPSSWRRATASSHARLARRSAPARHRLPLARRPSLQPRGRRRTPEEENTVRALRDHLRWDEARARAVLLRALDRGFIAREGGLLHLTPKGRAEADAIFEPWRRGMPAGAA
jgi:manganese/zinc/iron transport system permease protein